MNFYSQVHENENVCKAFLLHAMLMLWMFTFNEVRIASNPTIKRLMPTKLCKADIFNIYQVLSQNSQRKIKTPAECPTPQAKPSLKVIRFRS